MTLKDRSKKFIEDPDQWPNWPVLPMKRVGFAFDDMSGTGILLAVADKTRFPGEKIQPVIVHVNMWAIESGANCRDIFKNNPKSEYPSMDALLAAGWVVD